MRRGPGGGGRKEEVGNWRKGEKVKEGYVGGGKGEEGKYEEKEEGRKRR